MLTKKSEATAVEPLYIATGVVWVLAADEDVLVRFDDWQDVRALYQFVSVLRSAAAVRRLGGYRVLGASIEVDSPAVKAWHVDGSHIRPTAVARGLGDGALLLTAEAEKLPLVDENALGMVILKVGDDGMLIVLDEDGREATIDLSSLAAVVG